MTVSPVATVTPLRNMVLLELALAPQQGRLTVIQAETSIQRYTVLAKGPEVQDLQEGQTVLANKLAGTTVGNNLLVSETAILATL